MPRERTAPKKVGMCFNLRPELAEKARNYAEAEGITLSEFFRRLVVEKMGELE